MSSVPRDTPLMSTGRNDPCPCGSGKKFKACCLPLGRRLASSDEIPPEGDLPTRYRDFLALALAEGASVEEAELRAAVGLAGFFCFSPGALADPALEPFLLLFGAVGRLVERNGGEHEDLVQHFLPRVPFDALVDAEGRTAADLLLDRHGASLPGAAREAFAALIEAEDTLCRVDRSGTGFEIEDLRSGVRLPAPDGWRGAGPGMTCRLVRHRGRHVPFDELPVLDLADPWYLASLEEAVDAADELLDHYGLKLRSRYKAVAIGEEVLDLEADDEAAEEDENAQGRRPEVRNTDGDELVFTSLRWAVSDEVAVREALSRLGGLDLEETPEGLAGTFVQKQGPKQKHVPGESVSIGTLLLNGAALTVEVNSVERAEQLRRKLDKALGKAATFRTVTSEPLDEAMKRPVDPLAAARARAEQERLMALPEVREAMAKMGREHSLAWCDTTIPALGNRKPRTLVKTEKGRQKVEALLADFERRQAGREAPGMGMDLELIRKELGLG